MRRDEPGINNLVSLVGLRREERASCARGQQTASFLPARQHGDRKGHQGRSLGQRFTSCQGRRGSRDKYIRVTGRATCLWLSPSAFNPPDVNLSGSQVGNSCRERGMGAGAGGRQGLRGEVASFCVLPSLARNPESEVDKLVWGWHKKKNLTCDKKEKCFIFTHHAAQKNWQACGCTVFICYNTKNLLFWWHSPHFPSFHAIFRLYKWPLSSWKLDFWKLTEHFPRQLLEGIFILTS